MGTFPTITGAGTTTATKFFGDAMNRLSNLLNGVNISADVAAISLNNATTWTFSQANLLLNNPAGTFAYTIQTAAITAARTLNLPLLTGTDTVAVLNLSQVFTNKKIDTTNTLVDSADNTKVVSFSLTGITTATTRTITIPDVSSTMAVLGLTQTWTAQQTLSPTTTTALTINNPTAPVGSASEFISRLNSPTGTVAFATTAQTGDFTGEKLDKSTLTNPSAGTITNAATLKILGGPIAGSNVTITNKYALWISGDNFRVDGNIGMMTSPSFGLHVLGGQTRHQSLATPSAPVITNVGTTGSTTYTYFIVAIDKNGNKTLASASGSTTTGNATLSGTNYNTITWTAVPGAVSYDVLKTNTATSLVLATTALTVNDQGGATSAYTAPLRNSTSDVIFDGSITVANAINNQTVLTPAASVAVDFLNTNDVCTLANGATASLTITASNYTAGYNKTIIITNGSTAVTTLTLPAWTFVGAAAPTTIAANKVLVITIFSQGTTAGACIAATAAQP